MLSTSIKVCESQGVRWPLELVTLSIAVPATVRRTTDCPAAAVALKLATARSMWLCGSPISLGFTYSGGKIYMSNRKVHDCNSDRLQFPLLRYLVRSFLQQDSVVPDVAVQPRRKPKNQTCFSPLCVPSVVSCSRSCLHLPAELLRLFVKPQNRLTTLKGGSS